MTNSHNKSGKNGNQTERYFNNHSPQQCSGSGKRNNSASNNSSSGGRGPKSPSSTYFKSISTSNAIPIVKSSSSPVSSKGSNYYGTNSPSGRPHSFNVNVSYQRSSPGGGGNFNNSVGCVSGSSPPNFSHFAGSKCYDAPAPTALPKPPVHWTSSTTSINMVTSALNISSSTRTSTSKSALAHVAKNTNSKSLSSSSSESSKVKVRSVVKPALSCAAAAAKSNRNTDFTNNLKMILNVQA